MGETPARRDGHYAACRHSWERAGALAGRAGRPAPRRRGRARDRADDRRPARRRAAPPDGWHRRVRERGAGGGPRRSRRRRGALGQGPPCRHARRAACSPPSPSAPTPRDALVGSTLDDLPTGSGRRDRIGAPARAARRGATRSRVRGAARQHPDTPRQGRRRSTRSSWRQPRSTGSISARAPPSGSRSPTWCRRSGRARSRSSAVSTTTTTRAASGAIDDARVPRRGDRGACVPRGARRRVHAARRRAMPR